MALTLDKSVLDKIEALQNIMLASVTGGARDEAEYRQIRDELQNRRQRVHSLDRPPPSDCNGPYFHFCGRQHLSPNCRIVPSSLDDRNVTPGASSVKPGVIVGLTSRVIRLFHLQTSTSLLTLGCSGRRIRPIRLSEEQFPTDRSAAPPEAQGCSP